MDCERIGIQHFLNLENGVLGLYMNIECPLAIHGWPLHCAVELEDDDPIQGTFAVALSLYAWLTCYSMSCKPGGVNVFIEVTWSDEKLCNIFWVFLILHFTRIELLLALVRGKFFSLYICFLYLQGSYSYFL